MTINLLLLFILLISDGYTPDTCVSTLLPSSNQNSDTKLPSEAKDIVGEIEGDLKSINIQNAVHVDGKDYENMNIPTEYSIDDEESNVSTEPIPEENDSSEFRRDSKKNNSSIDIRKMAIELGISLPENVNVKEEDTPPNLYEEFLLDSGQVTLNDQGLEELESSTEKHSSDTESNLSEVDFEVHPNSDLPNFMLLFPNEENLTEKEKEEKKEVESFVEQYHESVLMKQISRTGSQHNQSFDSINNSESEVAGNTQESVDQLASSTKHSLKSSIDVPYLTFFTESTSTSSEKITIKVKPDSENTDAENKTTGSSISSVETVSSTASPFNMSVLVGLSGKSDEQHRPKSASPSIIYSIYEDEEFDDNNLFGSGEGSELLKHSNHCKSVDHISTGEGLVKRTPIKTPNLFLDLSPATKRKKYAGGNSMSDPSTADIKEGDRSPLPPTQPYYTPQVQRSQPFLSNKPLTKQKSTSGLGSSFEKSPPHLEIEYDTSGAWSSPRSQQEELLGIA